MFINQTGTAKSTTVPHHPKMNGVAERSNQTIINAARCAIAHAKITPALWNFAIMDAVFK